MLRAYSLHILKSAKNGGVALTRRLHRLVKSYSRPVQKYYTFTTVAPFEALRPERPNHPNFLKSKRVKVVPAGGIEPTA
jgi:hypothetical protein